MISRIPFGLWWEFADFCRIRQKNLCHSTLAGMMHLTVERLYPCAVAVDTERTPSLGGLCRFTPSRTPAIFFFVPVYSRLRQSRRGVQSLLCVGYFGSGAASTLLTDHRKTPDV